MEARKQLIAIVTSFVVLAAVVAAFAWGVFFRPHLPPAERGHRIAQREGCFTCHGPGGSGGVPNPGSRDSRVPALTRRLDGSGHHTELPKQIREWIRDGEPADRAGSASWEAEKGASTFVMPAYGDKLGEGEIDDLVAYVMAVGMHEIPDEQLAFDGMERAQALGCFACHGGGGRLAPPNPGSLKGYIPPWDGNDFPELVHDRAEFGEWVRNGISDRFAGSAFARTSVNRASVVMPGFEAHLGTGDIDAIWAYIHWLQSESDAE